MRATTVENRTYEGFDRRFTPDADWVAVALVVGDVTLFYLDGPQAATALHVYLDYEIEDGARLIGVYRRLPGTCAPFADADQWQPATGQQPTDGDVVPKNGAAADISGHEYLRREEVNRLTIHGDGWVWDVTSATPIGVHDMAETEMDKYYAEADARDAAEDVVAECACEACLDLADQLAHRVVVMTLPRKCPQCGTTVNPDGSFAKKVANGQ